MPMPRRGRREPRLVAVFVAAGCLIITVLVATRPAPSTTIHPAAPPVPAPSWANTPGQSTPVAAPRPVRVRIPAIGVDSSIVDIGVDSTGALVPPATADVVGWFTSSPSPGDMGPSLLAAHVDSQAGPGVFFRLVDLKPGDAVTVERADGSAVSFSVVSATRVAKAAFPTELVYAPLPAPMLRLITCGGVFYRAAHSYRDNVIVEAATRG
jgi:sortase (surface protein transpeptidase)